MPAKPDGFRAALARLKNLVAESFAVAGGIAWARRTVRALLAIGKIVTNNFDTGLGERVCDGDQQRRIAIRSGSMCENQVVQNGLLKMKRAARRGSPFRY